MVVRTGSVAWTGNSCFAVALDLLEMQVGQILDAGVEGAAGVMLVELRDPLCKH